MRIAYILARDIEQYISIMGLTTHQFAKACGIARGTLYRILDGYPVNNKTIWLICLGTNGKIDFTKRLSEFAEGRKHTNLDRPRPRKPKVAT